MIKTKVLSILLIFLQLFFTVLISGDAIRLSQVAFTDMKIKYLYTDYYNNAEFGEITNGQDLAIKMSFDDKIIITIWNYSEEDFYLDADHPIINIENEGYITIPNLPYKIIPVGGSITFQIQIENFPAIIKRTKIVIISEDPNDENFEFGLWLSAYSGSS